MTTRGPVGFSERSDLPGLCLYMADFPIPLYDKRGNTVGSTIVDADDAERLSQWRWSRHQFGYAVRFDTATKRTIGLHRVVLGEPPFKGAHVDHISRDVSDNRRSNLRWVTHAQNMQNRGIHRNNTSGYRGVMFDPRNGQWYGQIRRGGRKVWLRYFDNKESAAAATAAARLEILPYATA